jgi:hypothetical protein
MPDPAWLDTGVVHNALQGDAAINAQLTGYREAGRPLLIVPAVADELLNGNVVKGTPAPPPQFRLAMQQGMAKLGVEIDPHASKLPPNTRLADLYGTGSDNVSLSDRRVLNQIKASARAWGIAAPEMITTETGNKAMLSQASKWGIKAVPAAKPAPGSVPAPPRVDLGEEYPPDKNGPIARFFKDRPLLKQLGLIGAAIGAQYIRGRIFKELKEHFDSVLKNAKKEFESKYPDPELLRVKAGLERYKQAYLAASSKLMTPTGANIAKTVMLALTPTPDIARSRKYPDDQISKVRSAADGTRSGYVKVTEEYIDAMLALYVQLNAYSALGEIAADIRKRGTVLVSVAEEFKDLGEPVLSFASDIQVIYEDALSTQKELDAELIKVSDALAQVMPYG